MTVLGVGYGLRQLTEQLDDAFTMASVQATMWWLGNQERIEPVVVEVVLVLPWIAPLMEGVEHGLEHHVLPGPALTEGTPQALDTAEKLADVVEKGVDQFVVEPEPTSTLIGGPELEKLVQENQVLVDGEEAQRRDLAAALDQGEAAFWGRNAALEGEDRKQAEVMLEEARKEALRALEARQKEDREREPPTF